MIEAPQSFLVRTESEKAAWAHGFRKARGEKAGWVGFASTTAHVTIHLAATAVSGAWFLALDHSGVIAELDAPRAAVPGPGVVRYVFPALGPLYATLNRVYALALALPSAPLQEFEAQTAALPKTTEAERLVLQRIGQNIFRDRNCRVEEGRGGVRLRQSPRFPSPLISRTNAVRPEPDVRISRIRLFDRLHARRTASALGV